MLKESTKLALQCHAITARDALARAVAAPPGERLHRYEMI
jgi:hypothetical protein